MKFDSTGMEMVELPQRHNCIPDSAVFGQEGNGDAVVTPVVGEGVVNGEAEAVEVAVWTCWTTSSSPPEEATTNAPATPAVPRSAMPAKAQRGLFTKRPFRLAASDYAFCQMKAMGKAAFFFASLPFGD